MIQKLINKIGTDKLLHFFVGSTIAFIFSNIGMIQEGSIGKECVMSSFIGIIVATFAALMKDLIIDKTTEWKDILATFLGSLTVLVSNTIGMLFYIWSN